MLDQLLIGRESEPFILRIEPNAVRRFTEAIGIPFTDKIPPTYVGTFLAAKIAGVELPQEGTIHGEQKFTYLSPVKIGDNITITRRVKEVYERNSKLGKMIFVVLETTGCDPTGDLVFTGSSTLITPQQD